MTARMDESNTGMPAANTTVPPAEAVKVDRPVAPSLTAPLCPYCGALVSGGASAERCGACKGLLDPLSRQATQNAMGPWSVREDASSCTPGFSYETLRAMVVRGRIRRDTIVRGPTTRQFWMFAANTPGVAVLLGECHACHRSVRPDEFLCVECGASLNPPTDRQVLGLAPVRLLPGAASAPAVAASAVRAAAAHAPVVEIETPAPLRRGPVEIGPAPLVSHIDTEPSPASHPSVSLRRMTTRVHLLTVALVLAVLAMGALLVVLVAMALRDDGGANPAASTHAPAPSNASPPPVGAPQAPPLDAAAHASPVSPPPAPAPSISAPAPPNPIAMIDGVPVDTGLDRWRPDIEQAIALERADSLESLDQSIAILQGVFDEASSARTGGGDSMPILRERLAVLRERAAAWRARSN